MKTVSIVLGSGGARGYAHIGAIEELPISFTAVATDLIKQKEVWIQKGKSF